MILVVEDDPQVARLIALVLERHGYPSSVVPDGNAGLQRAKELLPDIIFADLTMKGMGGDMLCTLLKGHADTKEIPFIVVSGDGDIAERARQCGADGYMGKPFEFEELIRVVKKYARTESRKAD